MDSKHTPKLENPLKINSLDEIEVKIEPTSQPSDDHKVPVILHENPLILYHASPRKRQKTVASENEPQAFPTNGTVKTEPFSEVKNETSIKKVQPKAAKQEPDVSLRKSEKGQPIPQAKPVPRAKAHNKGQPISRALVPSRQTNKIFVLDLTAAIDTEYLFRKIDIFDFYRYITDILNVNLWTQKYTDYLYVDHSRTRIYVHTKNWLNKIILRNSMSHYLVHQNLGGCYKIVTADVNTYALRLPLLPFT